MSPDPHAPIPNAPQDRDAGVNQGTQALLKAVRFILAGLRFTILAMLFLFLFGGIFVVKEDQEAMLFRFGQLTPKHDREVLGPGVYWGFPYPIDRVETVKAQRSVTIFSKQFWMWEDPNALNPLQNPPQTLVPGRDGYLVTGDANIIHMIWAVTYRVSDAKKYYLDFYQDPKRPDLTPAQRRVAARGVEALIEDLLDQCVLHAVAGWPVDDVLVLSRGKNPEDRTAAGRESLSNLVQALLEKKVADLNLGVDIQQVSATQVQPPFAVLRAFREVVDAAVEYRKDVENAEADASRTVTLAQGQASQVLAEAHQYRDRVVKSIQADAKYFNKILGEYRKSPEIVLALYTDMLRDVLSKTNDRYIVHTKHGGTQEVRLLLGPIPKVPRNAAGAAESNEGESPGGVQK